ncbi:MAG: hypothetical protein R3C10_22180 [Pirellulales bacterium]
MAAVARRGGASRRHCICPGAGPPSRNRFPAASTGISWLGPAPQRPFNSVYVPGPKWYRWWDFGNGTMSDLGSHWIDLPFWALETAAAAHDRG